MEKTNNKFFLYLIVLALGLGALAMLYLRDNTVPNLILTIVLAISAMAIKIDLAKKGYKNIIATIGSLAGAFANVVAIFNLLFDHLLR